MASVVDTASTQIGVHESPPGSNQQKYGAEYGLNGYAWCAMFVWWCYLKALGVDLRKVISDHMASVDAMWRAGVLKGLNTSHPVADDIVIFHFPGEHAGGNHTGIFVKDNGNGTITTIEGNTSSASDTNGGEVARRTRSKSLVLGYLHPVNRPLTVAPAAAPAAPAVDYRKLAAAQLVNEMGAQPNMDGNTPPSIRVVVLQRSLNLVLPDAHLAENGTYGPETIKQIVRWQTFINGQRAGSITDFPGAVHETTRFFLVTALANIRDGKA